MRALLTVLMFVMACGESGPPAPSSAPPERESAPVTPSAPAPLPNPTGAGAPPPGEPARCQVIRQEAAAHLRSDAANERDCEHDDECGCLPAIIDCGGDVRSLGFAQRVQLLAREAQALGCDYRDLEGNAFNCSPRRCVPQCAAGSCRNQR